MNEQITFCSDCEYAKLEIEQKGLVIYCGNKNRLQEGFNFTSSVRKFNAIACNMFIKKSNKEKK